MKRLTFLFIAAMFISTTAYAAGSMTNVSNKADVSGATITSNPGSIGADASVGFKGFGADASKEAGNIEISTIENKGKMENVSNEVNAKGANITSNGAGIKIGGMSNK